MSAHLEIIGTDFRRIKIKVTPGTYLIDVLEEACKKWGLSSDKYLLKHNKKPLDLSLQFRTSSLTPGAKLELVVKSSSPSVVSVALQFSEPDARGIPGGRLLDRFASNVTLWKVLRHFESGQGTAGLKLNITGRGVAQTSNGAQSGSGQLYYEQPVLNVMGRRLASVTELQKTLSQLGINSGSVALRITFERTSITLFDAMQEISRFLNDVDPEKVANEPSQPSEPLHTLTNTDGGHEAATEKTEVAPSSETPATNSSQGVGNSGAVSSLDNTDAEARKQKSAALGLTGPDAAGSLVPVGVFSAPASSTPAAALLPEAEVDYTPSIAHAQLHQARLQASSLNKRLKSDQEIQEEAAAAAARVASIQSVTIRVRFPDTTSAQWQFTAEDTGATLFKAIRLLMSHDKEPFKLVLPGGKGVVEDAEGGRHKLIKGYGLTHNSLLSLNWGESASQTARSQPFLKSNVAKQAQEVVVPTMPAEDPEDAKQVIPQPAQQKSRAGESSGAANKIPKWLKLPGKK